MNSWKYNTTGIPDNEFIRGDIPMTKAEVRAVTLSKLKLNKNMRVLDIGAGTGSVSVECSLLGCDVTAIERKVEGIKLINQNIEKFGISNMEIIHGQAPEYLPTDKSFNRVFIGGSGGQIGAIFDYLDTVLAEEGIVVANTITIENNYKILTILKEKKYKDIEVTTMNFSRSKQVGDVNMMLAENPVTIISARKGS